MEITTPLGDDVLLFHGMHAREEMSRLSEFQLDLLSPKKDIKVDDILGKNVTVKLALPDDSTRYFNGYVTRFSAGGRSYGRNFRYSAVVRPWLWFLTRTTDCRIFQDMTVPDIVKAVFGDEPTADFKLELTGAYRKWTYCVQYRETDFNFVSRLMEEEGIYYYVRHTDGHNTVVLTDSTGKHTASPGYETMPFIPPEQVVRPELERISSWDFSREIQPGVYVHDDYDLERPSVELKTRKALPRTYTPSDYEIYDYPGHYLQKADGEQYAGVRIDELGSQFETAQAATNAKGVTVGSLFTLEGYPREEQNREHLILAASHDLEFSEYEAMPEGAGTSYRCSFVAMSSEQQFRPRRATPKPFVQGPQTAMVVGPAGDEIYTDKFGRVKVQFHWDRYGKKDENSSCWVRVSHPLAGKGWGSVSIPRIGQEVIVDFLEGDPDQPIITGRVYNAESLPPFGFPAGAVLSGVKSQTHKGSGYNEVSMDDTAGKEKVTINGQYDMNTTVGNNQTNAVGVDQSNKVGSNQTEDVGAKREISIGADDTVTIGANRETTIGAKHTVSVGGNEKVSVGGSREASVAGKEDVSIGGKSSLQVGASRTETIAGPHTIVNPRMTITSASQITVAAGSNFTATSPKVNLLAGSAFLANSGGKMDVKSAAGLTQQSGAAMNVKSGAALNVQSSAAMNLKSGAALNSQAGGAMNLKASGALTGKGSVIKLNSPTKIKGTTLTVQ
jgi:type VI secretion system secreted protein VgrG